MLWSRRISADMTACTAKAPARRYRTACRWDARGNVSGERAGRDPPLRTRRTRARADRTPAPPSPMHDRRPKREDAVHAAGHVILRMRTKVKGLAFPVSFKSVRAWLAERAPDLAIIDNGMSTATVAEAAAGARGARRRGSPRPWRCGWKDETFLLVTRGDGAARHPEVQGGARRAAAHARARGGVAVTGRPVGGVCPSAWRRRFPSIATCRCAPSPRSPGRQMAHPARSKSPPRGWPAWSRKAGSTSAGCRRSSRPNPRADQAGWRAADGPAGSAPRPAPSQMFARDCSKSFPAAPRALSAPPGKPLRSL